MSFDKLIRARKSVRKFKEKKPDWRRIIEAIDSARYAPSAGANYVLKFILISEKEKIYEISQYCNQPFISQVEYLVVVCSNPERTINLFGKIGETYVRQQAGAAMQNFLLKLTEKGLSTCWIGLFDEEKIKKAFKIPEKTQIEAIFPIGHSAEKINLKNKIDLDNILYFENYGNKQMKKIKKFD